MSSSSSSSSSVRSIKTIDIVLINRISNARTLLAAQAFRNSYYPTHHAKRRARGLRLSVDIKEARKLDQKFISTIPLPVLEISPVPPTQQAPVSLAKLEPALELGRAVVGREMKRLARPVLRCDIPQDVKSHSRSPSSTTSSSSNQNSGSTRSTKAPCVLRGRNIPWVGPTSCWSASTTGADESPDRSSVYSFDSVDDLGLPDTEEYETDGFPTYEDSDDKKVSLQIDLAECKWESGQVNGDSPLSTNSTGPVTPEDQESVQPNVVIRMKRSIPSDLELGDETLEKRPKYERKSWISRAKRSVNISTHDSKP